ncbi:hypothetical protein [Pseudoroseicyclus aestuarii]|uniref:Uncharacterized protein n=1 Tax=Pseudoroseicyclus aestuarii TaxID=1795041 RepID=A0A318T3K4_9RHOB|nr:hypothetical protein [Pseudoroseicyclus aestuarii]PYE84794.1 hypothetical protein DFP88_102597 [Pseudoroseicyclus aestuarii]
MSNLPKPERPNTLSGLVAKHAELVSLREQYHDQVRKLTVDIDHLDAAIRLFDGTAGHRAPGEYVTKHKARKGTVTRFVLQQFREATGPLTSRDITIAWCQDRGLVADDETYAVLRKRIGACIKQCALRGLIEDRGWSEDHGESGPYKLWVMVGR